MPSAFENVVEQALALTAAERLRLATELLESVEPHGGEEEIERAWDEEIQRRITQFDAGKTKFRAWDEIKRDFDSRYGR